MEKPSFPVGSLCTDAQGSRDSLTSHTHAWPGPGKTLCRHVLWRQSLCRLIQWKHLWSRASSWLQGWGQGTETPLLILSPLPSVCVCVCVCVRV